MTTIIVCDTCDYSDLERLHEGKTGGEILAEHVERIAADTELTVKRQSCLMGCVRHCNVAIQAEGKLTYVLGKFDPDTDSAEAVVEYAQRHSESKSGLVPFKQWPQGVEGHFVARIPALK